MSFYAYKITRDYGFAPNPFFGYCTLACCKPHIRKKANVGDWIIGTGAIENDLLFHIIFLMQVTDKLSFEQYWDDARFAKKKPNVQGSLKQMHGDNIYFKDADVWYQLDSHHSYQNGVLNEANLKQDLSGNYVLVSDHFYYFGDKNFLVTEKYKSLCPNKGQRDYITISDNQLANEFVEHIQASYSMGIAGFPINWREYIQLNLL